MYIIILSLFCYWVTLPLLAGEESAKGITQKNSNEVSSSLISLIHEIGKKRGAEESNIKIANQLISFSPEDINQIADSTYTPEEFDFIFKNLMDSGIPLPTAIVEAIWDLYLKTYQSMNGDEWDETKQDSQRYACLFLARYSSFLMKQLSPKQYKFFSLNIPFEISSKPREIFPQYMTEFMDVLINKEGNKFYEHNRIHLIKLLFTQKNFLEIIKSYFKEEFKFIRDAQIKLLKLYFTYKDKSDWINNTITIDYITKNYDDLKISGKVYDFIELTLVPDYVVEGIKTSLNAPIDSQEFLKVTKIADLVNYDTAGMYVQEVLFDYLKNKDGDSKKKAIIFNSWISFMTKGGQNFTQKYFLDFMTFLMEYGDTFIPLISPEEKTLLEERVFPRVHLTEDATTKIKDSIIKLQINMETWPYNFLKDVVERSIVFNTHKIKPLEIVGLYEKTLGNFLKLLYTDIPGNEAEKASAQKHTPLTTSTKIIFNNDAYIKNENGQIDVPMPNQSLDVQYGAPLVLKGGSRIRDTSQTNGLPDVLNTKDIPIGYNIFLPKGRKIKGIMVEVYGGYKKDERKSTVHTPNALGEHKEALLNQGIVIITLNLPDLLENTNLQHIMNNTIHSRIHAAIDYFWKTLKESPEKLHPGLKIPKETKIFLYGASFGGGMSLRHGEVYADTFDGYISHDGGLSSHIGLKAGNRSSLLQDNSADTWISPMDEKRKKLQQQGHGGFPETDPKIDLIKQPILLLHNFDDNRVHVIESLDFYKEALNSKKDVQLLITRRGNPITDINETTLKGHFIPVEKEAFETYANTIASFIIDGPSSLKSRSSWMAHQYAIYAARNFKSIDLLASFVSEAFRLYKTPYYRSSHERPSKLSLKNDRDLLKIESKETTDFSIAHEEDVPELHAENLTKEYSPPFTPPQKMIDRARHEQQAVEYERMEQQWVNKYRPIYKVAHYWFHTSSDQKKDHFKKLNEAKFLSSNHIKNALIRQLPLFFQFLSEYNFSDDYKNTGKDIITYLAGDLDFQKSYLNQILQYNILDQGIILIKNLLFANPDLIDLLIKMDPHNKDLLMTEADEMAAKKALWERILEDKQHIAAMHRELVETQHK